MRSRLVTTGILATVIAFVSLAASVAGQAPNSAGKTTKKAYVTPRTPWGDPDLQGTYTNKYEQGTPFERPNEFDGRRVEDIQGEELAAILQKRQKDADDRAPFLGGDPEGRLGGPLGWGDRFEIGKGGRAWFVVDPLDGKIPPQTPEARQRLAARGRGGSSFGNGPFNGPEDLSLYDRCITRGLPGSMLPAIYGDSYQIVQGPGYVGIRYEMVHETRVIPLEQRPHIGSRLRLDMGDARGHWDGETLVVETSNFRERSVYRNANPERLRLVERFTRIARDKVEWAVTVDDPTMWTRSWTFAIPLTMNDNEPVLEYACHEGNYAVRNILSGARVGENK
jgi:hypothetical protein